MALVNKTVTVTPALTISTSAYADGDVVGGRLNLNDLCGGAGGTVRSILLVDDDAESAAVYVYFFDGQPSDIADNAAFAPTVADLSKLVGRVALSSYTTLNSNTYALSADVNLSHGTGALWAYLVTNGSTPTYTATDDLTLKITGWVD